MGVSNREDIRWNQYHFKYIEYNGFNMPYQDDFNGICIEIGITIRNYWIRERGLREEKQVLRQYKLKRILNNEIPN